MRTHAKLDQEMSVIAPSLIVAEPRLNLSQEGSFLPPVLDREGGLPPKSPQQTHQPNPGHQSTACLDPRDLRTAKVLVSGQQIASHGSAYREPNPVSSSQVEPSESHGGE